MAQRKLEKTPEENRKTVDLVCLPRFRVSTEIGSLSSMLFDLIEKSDNTLRGKLM
jgi:hypothetical protein